MENCDLEGWTRLSFPKNAITFEEIDQLAESLNMTLLSFQDDEKVKI